MRDINHYLFVNNGTGGNLPLWKRDAGSSTLIKEAATGGGVLVAGVVITAAVPEFATETRHGFLSTAGATRITAATFTP